MAKYLNTDTLIASVKRRAMLPQTQATFQEADFLSFANEEMDLGITPHILSFHEDYFTFSELVTLEANVSRYPIPERAIGSKLRDVAFVDAQGFVFEMTRVSLENISVFQYGQVTSNNGLKAYYVEGNELVLLPSIGALAPAGYLKLTYFLRPNELVSLDRASTCQSLNRITGEIAVDQIPAHFSVGTVIDLIKTRSPHSCLAINIEILGINVTAKTITIDPTLLPANFIAGDYICSAEECIIPQAPSDLHSMLAQRIAARCLEALGDAEGLGAANAKLAEMEQKTGTLIDNRVDGSPQKLLATHGFLRTRRRRYLRR